MSISKLDSLLQAADRRRTPATASTLLSHLSETGFHRPQLVLEFGQIALKQHSVTTREHWDIVSDIIVAAAQVGEDEIADTYISKVMSRFPNSIRSFVLFGVSNEARGRLQQALSSYIDIMSKKPMSPMLFKRQVAVFKSEMKTSEAVALLNNYLTYYSSDVSAWAELCALCLQLGRFSHALFAANELILIDPTNYAAQITVSDVYVTCGGYDNLLSARSHYSSSLNCRTAPNLRALFGLHHTCSLLSMEDFESEAAKSKNEKLLELAKSGIRGVYANSKTRSSGKFVNAMLDSDY